jgi:DnaJ-class molecular chaperone
MGKHVDFYKILQVHHDAGQDIIDAAYRCLSKIYHPDINKSPLAAERMKDINIAYGVVGDIRKRREYHMEWLKMHAAKSVAASNMRERRI